MNPLVESLNNDQARDLQALKLRQYKSYLLDKPEEPNPDNDTLEALSQIPISLHYPQSFLLVQGETRCFLSN